MSITRLEVGRYKRLAIRSNDVWQGGLVRLPMWVDTPDGTPYRARGAFWRSARTGLVWVVAEDEPNTADAGLAVKALVDFAKKYDGEFLGRPSRLEVINAAFAGELRAILDDRDTTVAVVDDLPAVREALNDLVAHAYEGESLPASLLDMPGVTIDRLRGFADAAAAFHRAAPWEALDATDVLVVDSPVVPPSLSHVIVTGSTPDMRGLMAFETRRAFERFEAAPPTGGRKPVLWFLAYGPIDDLTFGDADAWTDHDLPVADADAYPRPGRPEGYDGLERPDARHLAGLEAILRALVESTDDDFDSGEWTRTVSTADGEAILRLSLPRLLDAMAEEAAGTRRAFDPANPDLTALRYETERAIRHARAELGAEPATIEDTTRVIESALARRTHADSGSTPSASPIDRAQDLAYAAMSAVGRRRGQLARRALAISRDCPDAWAVLAGRARDLDHAIELFREAVAAGERALGPEMFEREAGHFWGLVETRPYMRARLGLADCLDASGAAEEAIAHYEDLLRLNPNDNQAVRQPYLLGLLEAGRLADGEALINRFKDDERPDWLFAAALVAFRLEGDSTGARARLAVALASNRHVAAFLSGEREFRDIPSSYRPGSVDEAVICADWMVDAWQETPGAVAWLAARGRAPRRGRGTARRRPR